MKKILLVLPILLLACTKHETPAQSVFLAEAGYVAALRIELAYSKLPRCKPGAPILCSEVSVIRAVRKADDVAWAALQNAQEAVRTDGFGTDKSTTMISSAVALTNAFIRITKTLEVQ